MHFFFQLLLSNFWHISRNTLRIFPPPPLSFLNLLAVEKRRWISPETSRNVNAGNKKKCFFFGFLQRKLAILFLCYAIYVLFRSHGKIIFWPSNLFCTQTHIMQFFITFVRPSLLSPPFQLLCNETKSQFLWLWQRTLWTGKILLLAGKAFFIAQFDPGYVKKLSVTWEYENYESRCQDGEMDINGRNIFCSLCHFINKSKREKLRRKE